MGRFVFITGTGTGVGKTVLTGLLLAHARAEGLNAAGLKPFCSGSRADARLLWQLQKPFLTMEEVNPFFFAKPLSPWVAARESNIPQVPYRKVVAHLKGVSRRAEVIFVEGSGGILVPLGDKFSLAKIMVKFFGRAVVVGQNQLGIINHVLLTVEYLQSIGVKDITVVLMGRKKPDLSARGNEKALMEWLPGARIFCLPYLGKRASDVTNVRRNEKKLKKTLAQVLKGDRV